MFKQLSQDKAIEIHVDLPRWDYRLLPHSDLQLYFDHLENDVGATRYLVSRHPSYALRGIYHNYQNYEVVGRLCK